MGLLDDAIREHLDLKRRRGADPSEVARLEQEALGPVRREPAPAEPTGEQHDEVPAPAEPAEHPRPASEGLHPDDHTHVLAPEDRHEPPHGDPLFELGGAAAEAHQPASGAADAEQTGGGEAARPPAEGPADARVGEPDSTAPARGDAGPEPEPPDARHTDIVDQPTTEYHVEDHHGDEHSEEGGEDVLEETPDFLQETPEHDRLWFEQRPPRDFDFDG
jgi:hypothetical protein